MLGEIKLSLTIHDREYEVTELLSSEHFVISDNILIVSNDVYSQLSRMLRRICDRCYEEEILCRI